MIVVRRIRDRDHARVGALLVSAYQDAGPFDDQYLRFLARPGDWVPAASKVFVAQRAQRVVGVVAFTLPGDGAFEQMRAGPVADAGFRFLAVDPAERGRGVGRRLVRTCIEEARRRGCRRMVVHSMSFMEAAHRLYEREGFVRRPDLDVRFPTGVGLAFQRDLTDDADAHFPRPDPQPGAPSWFEDVWRL